MLCSKLCGEGLEGLGDGGDGILDGAIEAATGRIQMASAIEELLGHLIGREVIHRPQTYPYQLLLRVLTQRDGEFQTLDLLGDVDQSLSIALRKWKRFCSSRVRV